MKNEFNFQNVILEFG